MGDTSHHIRHGGRRAKALSRLRASASAAGLISHNGGHPPGPA